MPNINQHQPKPLFDTLEWLIDFHKSLQQTDTQVCIKHWLQQCVSPDLPAYVIFDYLHSLNFLYSYRGSPDTFNAYRREIERFIQWTWFIQKKSINALKRLDIEAFIDFCKAPDKAWITNKTVARFILKAGIKEANPEWRPFNVKVSKKAFADGKRADIENFELSQQAIKSIFAVLSSFYNYLLQEEFVEINPVLQIRQKSKFIQKNQQLRMVRRLSDQQWQTVIQTAEEMASNNPPQDERTLFMMSALYAMYLRISELAATNRWMPQMNHFFRDGHNNWWFKTVGKGNKMRQIAVSDAMLQALRRWRQFLGLTPLPTPDDQSPLIPKFKGQGPIESTRAIRQIVQKCFDLAVEKLHQQQFQDEAEMLRTATVHWLRHTGISDDVRSRPLEDVREDAGHSSGAITDRYIDSQLQKRAQSAKKKQIVKEISE